MPRDSFLNVDALRAALGPYAPAVTLSVYDEIDSTNTRAKATAAEDASPSLHVARTQTAGRGRLGRSFHSPADTGLYMTLAYTTAAPLGEAVRITGRAAVAAAATIEALTPKRPAIKWVNDLYLDGCKIGGILTEAVTRPDGEARIIVGLGINLSTTAFPEDLRAPASCLFPREPHLVTPALMGELAGGIARRLLDAVDSDPAADLDFYRRHLLYRGQTVLCTRGNTAFEATLLDVDDSFSLLVSVNGSPVTLSSGEISLRPTAD